METNIEKRLQRWKEEFELLYSLSKDDSFEALEECMRLVIRLGGGPMEEFSKAINDFIKLDSGVF